MCLRHRIRRCEPRRCVKPLKPVPDDLPRLLDPRKSNHTTHFTVNPPFSSLFDPHHRTSMPPNLKNLPGSDGIYLNENGTSYLGDDVLGGDGDFEFDEVIDVDAAVLRSSSACHPAPSSSDHLQHPDSTSSSSTSWHPSNLSPDPEDRHEVRQYLKKLSDCIRDPKERDIDQTRLSNAVREGGEYSYGIDAIAVWEFDEDTGVLVPLAGGWWSNPRCEPVEALTRPDFSPLVPVAPGVDLAGILWAESDGSRGLTTHVPSSSGSATAPEGATALGSLSHRFHSDFPKRILWRDLHSLAEDPFSAKGENLPLLEAAGFRKAAGVTYHHFHHRGLVVFLTREIVDTEARCSLAHSSYLIQAAQFIGAAAALADVRRATLATTRYQLEGVPEEENESITADDDHHHQRPKPEQSPPSSCVPHRMRAWATKMKGGTMQIPPEPSTQQALWTVLGAFCGLLTLSGLSELYGYLTDDRYYLLMAPFGALVTLQYALTSAPASQPRNAVFGEVVAGAVSLAFTYVPTWAIPVWVRLALGPAFGIGAMFRLGVVNPPSGAHAVIYASGDYDWTFYGLVVLSTIASIVPSMVVNNLSLKRQYPTYWGFLPSWWRRPKTGPLGKYRRQPHPSKEGEKISA